MRDALTLRLAAVAAVAATMAAPLLLGPQQALASPHNTEVPQPPHMPRAQQPVQQQPVQQQPVPNPEQVPQQPAPVPRPPDVPAPAPPPQRAPQVQQPQQHAPQPEGPPNDTLAPAPQVKPPGGSPSPPPGGTATDGPLPHPGGTATDGPLPHPGGTATDGPLPNRGGTATDGPLPSRTPPSHVPAGTGPTEGIRPPGGQPADGSHGVGPSGSPGPSWNTTGPKGREVVVPKGDTSTTVPLAQPPRGVQAPREAVDAARVAPAVRVDAAQPPPLPPKVDFEERLRAAAQAGAARDQEGARNRHWDYVDYDEYHRAQLFNPLTTDMTFRYFYGGQYLTAQIPPGGRILLDAATAGVYPFTVVAGDIVSVGSFLGGAWIPPLGWDGPPPADWVPWSPTVYEAVPVYFAAADQTVGVDRLVMVGHDETAPSGQQDVFQLNDSTIARGQVTPAPDGGPPQVTVQATQPLPGVSRWTNGQDWINTSVEKPAVPTNNHLPWVFGGLAAVLAVLGGVAAWVWKHPRGAHAYAATANAPTDIFNPVSPTHWLYSGGQADSSGGAWSQTDMWRRPPTS